MADISLHELGSGNYREFESFSTDISRRLLKVTTQLRSVDKPISVIERRVNDGQAIEHDDIDVIETQFENIEISIDDLREDVKELEKLAHGERRYRDDDEDEVEGEDDKRKHLVVEKLGKGVNETRRLLGQMQATVLHIKTHPVQSTDVIDMQSRSVDEDDDDTTSRGVIGGKVFQIQHTPLNAEQIEAQHYEAIQREAEINKIVNSVGELNQIFHDMDTLVSSQGEMIDNIESNIYSTLENTRYADRELRKADSWDRKRRRMSCVLVVVVVIVMFILLALIS